MNNKTNKHFITIRNIELILIDTAIIFFVWIVMLLLSTMAIGSFQVNGVFSFKKIVALYICIMVMRFVMSMYHSILRYADAKLYIRLILGDLLGGAIYFVLGRIFIQNIYVGFSYTLVTVMFIIMLTLSSRLCYQLQYAYRNMLIDNTALKKINAGKSYINHKINVAIVGAGNVGASLASEFIRNPKSHYNPYIFIDNDNKKVGLRINGIRVYGEDEHIVDIIKNMPIQEIIVALPEATPEGRNRLYNLYKDTNCKIKIYDYPTNSNELNAKTVSGKPVIREFKIEDLLFRDSLDVKSDSIKAFYSNKVVLVTGGGGSIGSELCRQIARLHPKKLVIVDIYENNAYEIQQELVRNYGDRLCLQTIIASVRDSIRIDEIFNEIRPQIVFHAAAHKHVPLMENSGCEAIKNNVFGTYNVANAAEKYGVEKFLLISTDKAVNPTNIMGASKRICEMVIQCRTDSKTEFTAVRFGNVLGSNGSVIPLFKRQIENGGPITLTDKRIIRYFMTIPEAVGLVMETCAMAKNGELFVLDMGKPVKILDLAENMIRLSGLKPYEDIDIVEIGLRPGEKLYEELLMKSEDLDKTENEMIFIERDKGLSREEVEDKLSLLQQAISSEDKASSVLGHHDDVLDVIRKTVPTFHLPEEVNAKAAESDEMKMISDND